MNRLEQQLKFVKKTVPFYQQFDHFNKLEDFPIVNKKDIKDRYELFISDKYSDIRSNLAERLQTMTLPLSVMEEDFNQNITIEKTSGSSGFPFYTAKTNHERVKLGHALWKLRRSVVQDCCMNKFLAVNHIGKRTLKVNPYDFSLDNIIKFYQYLHDIKIETIHIQSRILVIHINALKNCGIQLDMSHLKTVECNGNYLSYEEQKIIESYLGVVVYNQYGLMETWPIALGCSFNRYHINTDAIYLELVDENDKPISEFGKTGRVIITTLITELLPYIRYDTGDYGKYLYKECDCNTVDTKKLSIINARNFNVIKGVDKLLFGTIEFEHILNKIKNEHMILIPNDIQIYQRGDQEFVLYMSALPKEKNDVFLQKFQEYTEQLLQKKTKIYYQYLAEDDIAKIKYSHTKYYLFINESIPGLVDKIGNKAGYLYKADV